MKVKFKTLMVLVVLFAMSLAGNVGNAELVAYWALDGDASDSIGSSDGTVIGSPNWEIGRFDGALAFDGNDAVDLGNPSILDFGTRPWTVCAWIKTTYTGKSNIFGKGGDEIGGIRYALHVGEKAPLDAIALTVDDDHNKVQVKGRTIVADGQWHHVVGMRDGTTLRVYVDGIPDGTETILANCSLSGTSQHNAYIGAIWNHKDDFLEKYFIGLIDDVVVFDHALKEEEIVRLYRLGGVSFISEPMFLMLFNAVPKAETILKEQRPQEAMTLLKKTIDEYEQWKQKDPNAIRLTHKVLSCDLYFLLAKAKEAAGAPKADVADTYRRAIESGALSAPRQGFTLLWLHENTNADEYGGIAEAFIQNNSDYLKQVAAKAEMMVREQKSKAAIRFLEGNLAAYTRWQEKHPDDDVAAEDILPEIYFQLAKAKEAAKAPKEDVADAYKNTFKPSRFEYVPQRVAALTWLVENGRKDECAKVIESFAQSRDTKACFKNTVGQVCKHFESEKDLPKFQWFLDTLLTEAEYPYDWVIFVESCLGNKTNRWAKAFYAYLDSKPRLKLSRDCYIAETHVANQKFEKAAELYRDIMNRCGPEDDKGAFEFQVCRCSFEGGQYSQAIPELERFIPNNKATHRSLVKEAMLMKGRAHIQLGELDKAIDSFFTMTIEYPETKEAPETNFFVGYCYMLQGRFDQATEAFSVVVQTHPKSSYASKVRMCLVRIKEMTQ